MNIRLDLNPSAWRAAGDLEPQHRARKRHVSREGFIRLVIGVASFAAGLAL